MIKKLTPLFLFVITLIGCTDTEEAKDLSEDNSAPAKETEETIETIQPEKKSITSKEVFELIIPDTTQLKKEYFNNDLAESLAHAYLSKYYQPVSDKDSVEYYGDSEEYICHFYQEFEFGISYTKYNCSEEGGAQQKIVFPLVDAKLAKEFVNTLFYDSWNTWTTDLKYEADGAGCYYTIIQTETQTIIDIWCGC